MQKSETYKISKYLINEAIEQIKKDEYKIFSENEESMMMLLIAITKFIEIKQDIVTKDKNKKQDKLSDKFPKHTLQQMVFKGYFKIIDNPTQSYLRIHKEQPVKIYEIKQGKEKDASWIIDNIRDALAHNHFEINYEKQVIHIINQRPDRKLICDIDFYWMIRFYHILGTNKVENNYPKLQLEPIMYIEPNIYNKQVNKIEDIERLNNGMYVCLIEIEFNNNINIELLQKTKMSIYEKWHKLIRTNSTKLVSKDEVEQKAIKLLKEIKQNFSSQIKQINIKSHQKEEIIKQRVINRIKENNHFFNQPNYYQKNILEKITGLAFQEQNPKQIIETGLDTIMSTQFMNHDKGLQAFNQKYPEEKISNKYCYSKEKLIALLYLKGVTNFVLYKESIYDNQIDYDDIDISKFKYYDYGKIIKLKKQIEELEKQIESKQKELLKQQDILIKKQNAPEHKKEETKQKIEQITTTIEELDTLHKKSTNIIDNSPTDENNKPYQLTSNQEFFTHLRNALAHTWIKFNEQDNKPLEKRTVEIEDFNDKGELVFKCSAPYSTWIKLLDNDIFLQAITNYEHNYQKNMK